MIRVATELYGDELQALQASLERYFGYALQLEVQLDPSILGGVWVKVGDTVIDGTVRGRLEALRHHLSAQCRIIVSTARPSVQPEHETQQTQGI